MYTLEKTLSNHWNYIWKRFDGIKLNVKKRKVEYFEKIPTQTFTNIYPQHWTSVHMNTRINIKPLKAIKYSEFVIFEFSFNSTARKSQSKNQKIFT